MSDEAFHEIQLNGKQLVFLFMAATVVAVVIFLCGVMVGRGVQVPRVAAASQTPLDIVVDPTASRPVASTGPVEGTPLTAQETLTYAERLEGNAPAAELLKPVETASLPQPITEPAPPRVADVPAAREALPARAAAATFTEPAGTGLVVQVAAVGKRAEAETIARRLSARGYPVFITTTGANTFRVRVGKYPNQREAEAVAARLEKEEQFKPWITR